MSNVNNYYGAVIINDTVELRELLLEHEPTIMDLLYESDGNLTTMHISTEDENFFYYNLLGVIIVGTTHVHYGSIRKCKFKGKDGVTYQYSL